MSGCTEPSGPAPELIIDWSNAVLQPGQSTQLGVTLRQGGLTYRTLAPAPSGWPTGVSVSWLSSNGNVASVGPDGTVTGVAPGRATITSTVEGQSVATVVDVRHPSAPTTVYSRVSLGNASACALTQSGEVVCWGSNWLGALGTGAATPFSGTLAPTPLNLPGSFVDVAVGGDHACAVTAAREVYCWGSNLYGERGSGDPNPTGVPTKVQSLANVSSIGAGAALTCALTTDGTAFCWGRLGTTLTSTPKAITGRQFTSIAVGGSHACGLVQDGSAYCWGASGSYELGTGGSGDGQTPQLVAGSLKFTQLTAGVAHTCGITTSGEAYCWGTGTFGRLGTGSETSVDVPTRVNTSVSFTSISAGSFHTCAVTVDESAYCWGRNFFAELGDSMSYDPSGTATDLIETSPVRVTSEIGFQSISASGIGHFTCALSVGGAAFCWGRNSSGELGMGRRELLPGTLLYVATNPRPVVDPVR